MPGENMEDTINAKILSHSRGHLSESRYALLLVAPALVIIFFFALYPLVYAVVLSLRHVDLTSQVGVGEFVGGDNYRWALRSRLFWGALGRTMIFSVGVITVEMVLGVFIAFMLNRITFLKGLFRSMLILPLAAAPAAVGLIWRYMYHPDFGVYNYFMSILGLPEQNWLGREMLALPSVMLFDIWQWTPFVAIITLAGLQALPKEPFEAAELDGGSAWQVHRRLTFPMLRPVLTLVFVLRTIDAIRLYDPIVMLTSGGPGTATETLTYYIYRVSMRFFRMDHGSAMSLIFLYGTVVFCLLVLRRLLMEMGQRAERE